VTDVDYSERQAKRKAAWVNRSLKWRGHVLKPHCDICDVCGATVVSIIDKGLACVEAKENVDG